MRRSSHAACPILRVSAAPLRAVRRLRDAAMRGEHADALASDKRSPPSPKKAQPPVDTRTRAAFKAQDMLLRAAQPLSLLMLAHTQHYDAGVVYAADGRRWQRHARYECAANIAASSAAACEQRSR